MQLAGRIHLVVELGLSLDGDEGLGGIDDVPPLKEVEGAVDEASKMTRPIKCCCLAVLVSWDVQSLTTVGKRHSHLHLSQTLFSPFSIAMSHSFGLKCFWSVEVTIGGSSKSWTKPKVKRPQNKLILWHLSKSP